LAADEARRIAANIAAGADSDVNYVLWSLRREEFRSFQWQARKRTFSMAIYEPFFIFIAFCCAQVQYFIAASGCGTMPSFRWGDAASVPSAGVTLFQTDLAFLPV
jgi:hypothetical protein